MCSSKQKSPQNPTPKPCPLPNQHSPEPSELSQVLGISSKWQFIKHHLQCFMPVPRDHVFGVRSDHFPAPASTYGVSQAQVWAYPHRKQIARCPACLSAWVNVSVELLMGGYFDPSKATVERKQNSDNQHKSWTRAWAVSSGKHPTKVRSFYRWQRRQSRATNLSGP